MLGRLRDAWLVWKMGEDGGGRRFDWTTALVLIVGMAVFGVIGNTLVWATIEGLGR